MVCRRIATVGYQTGRARASINVMPVVMNEAWGHTEDNWSESVEGSGTVTIEIENDYTRSPVRRCGPG